MGNKAEKVYELLKQNAENVSANHWINAIHEDKFEDLSHKIVKLFAKKNENNIRLLREKYKAWAKYPEKYTAKEVLNQILADIEWLDQQKEDSNKPNFYNRTKQEAIYIKDRLHEADNAGITQTNNSKLKLIIIDDPICEISNEEQHKEKVNKFYNMVEQTINKRRKI